MNIDLIDVSFSIVLFQNDPAEIENLLVCISEVSLTYRVYLIDNSETDYFRYLTEKFKNIVYIKNSKNIGYGRAHNVAFAECLPYSRYHVILNPDVFFEAGTIEKLYQFMEDNPDIGQTMPKILYEDGSVQKLCKLLPSPIDLFVRRFLKPVGLKVNLDYELNDFDYNTTSEVPSLSGCFMFVRSNILTSVKGFDPMFFLYLEDFDLTRRIHNISKTVFFPGASAIHRFEKASYNNPKMLMFHIISAIRYFNKWGWFNDQERTKHNHRALGLIKNNIGLL